MGYHYVYILQSQQADEHFYAGRRTMTIVWPAFGWLEYSAQFAHHLQTHHRCVWSDEHVKGFDPRG